MKFSAFLHKTSLLLMCGPLVVSGTLFAMDTDKPMEVSTPNLVDHISEADDILDISSIFKEEEDEDSKNTKESIVAAPEIVISEVKETKAFDISEILFPEDIYAELIKYTIGQDAAMKSLATFIHEHLVATKLREAALLEPKNPRYQNMALEKPNILMMGPTGCGKTSSIEVLSKLLKIPFAVGNATEWTAQGYIGGKWQNVFENLVSNAASIIQKEGGKKASGDIIKKAEHGIIFIDEIDKLCSQSIGDSLEVINRVQQELLPAIQGMELSLESGGKLNTTNILFIAGGAFPGLIKSDTSKEAKSRITPKMLESYGMLPELAGRLCNIVLFSALKKEDLKNIILTSNHSFLQRYIKKYDLAYNIELTFADEAIDYIAEVASHQQTGARALNAMIYKLMEDKTFEIKKYVGKPLHIDKKETESALKSFLEEPKKEDNTSHLMMYT